ncbi:MAG: MerR family transcriptional regulator [Acidimicrobiales bacterium]|nr:MerR family transcriptional regulator [Acidimicrobiales bacterium]
MTDGRSIGQVLELLQADFPDVTISKIRFLETKGLISPDRAASGYRRFSETDVERLRWILTQQRDKFLPLRIIRQLLDTGAWRSAASVAAPSPSAASSVDAAPEPAGEPDAAPLDSTHEHLHDAGAGLAPRVSSAPDTHAPSADDLDQTIADAVVDPWANPLVRAERPRRLKRRELLDESGLDNDQLRSLEQLGLLKAATDAEGRTHFDTDALTVARLAARFFQHGIEPRHLRAFKVAAEKEAALFEQRLFGQLGRPGADATSVLAELVALGTELRAVLLRGALAAHLPGAPSDDVADAAAPPVGRPA